MEPTRQASFQCVRQGALIQCNRGVDQLADGLEQRRIAETFAGYRRSRAKRRAWSAGNPGNRAIRRELVGAVFDVAAQPLRHARNVLDAGCGTGWWLEQLARSPGCSAVLHGVDLLPERVAAAGERVPAARLEVGDIRSLPYPTGSFDAVFLFTVLSSLPDRDACTAALSEAKRVLRPYGVLLIWEPRIPNPLNRQTVHVGHRLLQSGLGGGLSERSLTVLPPLARRLRGATDVLYPVLASIPILRTHRLAWRVVVPPT